MPENEYLPNISNIPEKILDSSVIMYICSPSNPHGSIASLNYLKNAILLARKYNFILAIDECYGDIYRLNKPKPPGGLDAALSLGDNLDNVIVFNSLSKRSNASGMRAGFIAGDEKIIDSYKLLVSNGASPVPIPIQKVAAALYDDEEHNTKACIHYDQNFQIVEKYLKPFDKNFKIPGGGFFLWLKVDDDEEAAKILWNKFSLRVMPGRYMAKDVDGFNPGKGYLRIAIVDNKEVIEEAMKRVSLFLKSRIFKIIGFSVNKLDEEIQEKLSTKIFYSGFSFILLFISISLCLMLISFSPDDPSWGFKSNKIPINFYNVYGAWIAGFIIREFGIFPGLLTSLVLFIWSLKLFNRSDFKFIKVKIFVFFLNDFFSSIGGAYFEDLLYNDFQLKLSINKSKWSF